MSRSRSLTDISHKLVRDSDVIATTLSGLLAPGKTLNVLEVGFGHGRPLLELAWRFRNEAINFFGVDKRQKPPVEKSEDLREVARLYEIAPEAQLAQFKLPEVFFYDATQLHFEDESLDLIYAVIVVRFLERKAEFLEEVGRVLRPGGVALLHFGESDWDYPYSRICDDTLLTPHASRIVLKHEDELIPLPAYLKFFEHDAFRFRFIGRPRCVLRMKKLQSARLHLQLRFIPELSLAMHELPFRHGLGNARGGSRSVYHVAPEVYRALLAGRFLTKDFEVAPNAF